MIRLLNPNASEHTTYILEVVGRKEYLQLLGFGEDEFPTIEEIKKATKDLSIANHPDRGGEEGRVQEIQDAGYRLIQ